MAAKSSPPNFLWILILHFCLMASTYAQIDSSHYPIKFDSQLLRLKVPEAFQRSSLKLEVFSDSSWQLYQGDVALEFEDALGILGKMDILKEFQHHRNLEQQYFKEFRTRRVFSIISSVGGLSYLVFIWNKGWEYQIPGYAALAVAAVRYQDSRKLESLANRESYFSHSLISPGALQKLVDDYNFNLYQFLSGAGIQFRDQ